MPSQAAYISIFPPDIITFPFCFPLVERLLFDVLMPSPFLDIDIISPDSIATSSFPFIALFTALILMVTFLIEMSSLLWIPLL